MIAIYLLYPFFAHKYLRYERTGAVTNVTIPVLSYLTFYILQHTWKQVGLSGLEVYFFIKVTGFRQLLHEFLLIDDAALIIFDASWDRF